MALTNVQKFYIDGHIGTMSPRELATELEVPLRSVNAYVKRNPRAERPEEVAKPEAAEPPKPKPGGMSSFAVREGIVSMTPQASIEVDESTEHKPVNEAFFAQNRLRNAIFRPDPSKPSR